MEISKRAGDGLRENFWIEPSVDPDMKFNYFLEWPGSQATLQIDRSYKLIWTSSMGETPYGSGSGHHVGDDVNCAYNGTLYHLKVEFGTEYSGEDSGFFLRMSGVGSLNTLQILNLLQNYTTTSGAVIDRRREFYYVYNTQFDYSSNKIHLQYAVPPADVAAELANENNTGSFCLALGSYPFNKRNSGGTKGIDDDPYRPRYNFIPDSSLPPEDGNTCVPFSSGDAPCISRLLEDSDYDQNHNYRNSGLYTQDSRDTNYILLTGNLPTKLSQINSSGIVISQSDPRVGRNIHMPGGGSFQGFMQDSSGNASGEPRGANTLNQCNIIHSFDFYDNIWFFDNEVEQYPNTGGNGGVTIDSYYDTKNIRDTGTEWRFSTNPGFYANLYQDYYYFDNTNVVDIQGKNANSFKWEQGASLVNHNRCGMDISALAMGSFYKNGNKKNYTRFYYTLALVCRDTYSSNRDIQCVVLAPWRFVEKGQALSYVHGYGVDYMRALNGNGYICSREFGAPYSHSGGSAGTTLTLNFSNEGGMCKKGLTQLDFGYLANNQGASYAGPENQKAMIEDYNIIILARKDALLKMFMFSNEFDGINTTGNSAGTRLTVTVSIPSNISQVYSAYLVKSRRCKDKSNHEG